MSLVLFLFLIMTFAEKLEDKWADLEISKAQISRKDNSQISTVQLVSHQTVTFTYGMLLDLFCILYVDDGSSVFGSRTEIKIGITLLSDHFTCFGPKMHISTGKNPFKKLMHILPASIFLQHMQVNAH